MMHSGKQSNTFQRVFEWPFLMEVKKEIYGVYTIHTFDHTLLAIVVLIISHLSFIQHLDRADMFTKYEL